METREKLIEEIQKAPDDLVEEVLNFLLFTKNRQTQIKTKPIWELADEIVKDIPQEVLDTLPNYGASQHDHYLYGSLKR